MSGLAIDGGVPVRRRPFPRWPVFDGREEKALLEVLHSGQWSRLSGDKVRAFEERFCAYQNARYGIGVPSGATALELSLRACDLGPGDEVLTTGYTFIATANAILLAGARPVFVDVSWDSLNLDPSQLAQALTPRTRAVLPVHLAGRPADMDAVLEFAAAHQLKVVEDACQAWGSEWRGRRVGALGHLGAFSFQASKNITAGEGGIVLTNDAALAERCFSLHNVGRRPDSPWYQHHELGWNHRMTEWAAAILGAQLERLPEQEEARAQNARHLREGLREVPGLEPLPEDPRVTRQSHHYVILRYDAARFGGRSRDQFIVAMRAEGIEPFGAGYQPCLLETPALRDAMRARFGAAQVPRLEDFPVTQRAVRECVWLFHTALLERADVDSVVEAARKISLAWA